MPQIDFYILDKSTVSERLAFACRLVEKVVNLKHKVLILTSDMAASKSLDDLLWTFRPESFVPHQVINNGEQGQSPVLITHHMPEVAGQGEVLINLSTSVPGDSDHFQRVVEIVVQDPEILHTTRQHFTYYRDRGYAIETHNIK